MNDKLLLLLSYSEHLTDWELAKKTSKKPDTVYLDVVNDLKELHSLGQVAIIGKKFIDQHGKLFDVYTTKTDCQPERENALAMKQKNAQIISHANTLYAEFKEHMTVQAITDAAELIKQGKGKRNLQFHQLSRADVLAVYKRVAKDAPKWCAEEIEHVKRLKQGLEAKKFKSPY